MKKIIIILVVVLLLGGVGAYFWLQSKDKDKDKDKEGEEEKVKESHEVGEKWNDFSYTDRALVTLPDYILSVAKGDYTVKMTVTVEFADQEALDKYHGLDEPKIIEEEEEASHGGTAEEEHAVTPMEVEINSFVGEYMIQLDKNQVKEKNLLEKGLTTYLNQHLKKEGKPDLIKHVYIENYVFN